MFTTFSAWALDFLSKAAGHKYIRRIPYASGGKTRYRYIYKVTHTARGKHALHEDDVTVGAAFMLGTDKGAEVHAHVKSVNGDKVTVEYDDGPRKGEKETMSKKDLLAKLDAAHGISQALRSEREKQAKVISELRAKGASEKQIAREQARLDRLGVEAKEPEAEKPAPRKRAPKAPKATTETSEPKQDKWDGFYTKEARDGALVARDALEILAARHPAVWRVINQSMSDEYGNEWPLRLDLADEALRLEVRENQGYDPPEDYTWDDAFDVVDAALAEAKRRAHKRPKTPRRA